MHISPWSRSVRSGRMGSCWCPEAEWAERLLGCEVPEAEPNSPSATPSWLEWQRESRKINQHKCTAGAGSPLKSFNENNIAYCATFLMATVEARQTYLGHKVVWNEFLTTFSLLMALYQNYPFLDLDLDLSSVGDDEMTHIQRGERSTQPFGSWICMVNTNVVFAKDIYRPPADCSNKPSSAGITKCVTFTTSLLVSSWKSYCIFNQSAE